MRKVVVLVMVLVGLFWFSYRFFDKGVRFEVSLPFRDGMLAKGSVINCRFDGIVGNFLVGFDSEGRLVVCLLDRWGSRCKVSADVRCRDRVCVFGSRELEEAYRYAETLVSEK